MCGGAHTEGGWRGGVDMGDHIDHLSFAYGIHSAFTSCRPTDRQTFGIIETPLPELRNNQRTWIFFKYRKFSTNRPTNQPTFGTIEAPVPEFKNKNQKHRN